MKRLVLSLTVVVSGLLSFAQTNQMVWNNGRMQYAAPIVNVDSLTFPNEVLESDTLYFILPRSMKQVVHDTIYKDKLVYVRDTIYIHPNALEGAFSVAADKQVAFSKGNLQYTQSTKTWEFANEQYEIIGNANVNNGALADKIDLFGWSASNTTVQWGIGTSYKTNDYYGDFKDWGQNIGNGNTWRTLSKDEWAYLFQTRTDASSKYGVARINLNADGSQYMNGLIVLPDSWTCPTGISFKSGVASEWGEQYFADYQTFTLSQWQQLEQAGAVFLPAAGFRSGGNVSDVQSFSIYWASTRNASDTAYGISFESSSLSPEYYTTLYDGRAVRLVKEL